MPDPARLIIMMGLLATAVYTDLRLGKIYNKLTIPCAAFGIALNAGQHGVEGLVQSVGGAALVVGLFVLFAPKVGIGGGDTKLMMAVGALTGLRFAVWAMLVSALIGGILALWVVARRRMLSETARSLATSMYLGAPLDFNTGSGSIRFAYSPAIALGSLVTLLLGHRLGWA
jgi:prepilin peptidase CpaA